jgi:hypothetical protein
LKGLAYFIGIIDCLTAARGFYNLAKFMPFMGMSGKIRYFFLLAISLLCIFFFIGAWVDNLSKTEKRLGIALLLGSIVVLMFEPIFPIISTLELLIVLFCLMLADTQGNITELRLLGKIGVLGLMAAMVFVTPLSFFVNPIPVLYAPLPGEEGRKGGYIFQSSSVPPIEWEKCFGGSDYDTPNSVEETNDGGYIIAGRSTSNDGDVSGNHGKRDAWIVKLKSNGELDWQKTLGGSGDDAAHAIRKTSDGGYIVAGYSEISDEDVSGKHRSSDCWVVKLKSNGEIEWQKLFGGSNPDEAWDVQQTSDDGYIIAGSSTSNDGDVSGNHGKHDAWIVKLKSNGELDWQKSLGGSNLDYAYAIRQTKDGGYIIAGTTFSDDGDVSGKHKSTDGWVVKLKSNGKIDWQKFLGGSNVDSAYSVQQTSDGGYIVAGYSQSNDGDVSGHTEGKLEKIAMMSIMRYSKDFWIVKLKADGAIEWQKALGGSGYDEACSVRQTDDGGYIVAGYSRSNDGDVSGHTEGKLVKFSRVSFMSYSQDFWIVKLKADGTPEWQKSLGGSSDDRAYDICPTKDKGYIVVGYTDSDNGDVSGRKRQGADFWVVKLGAE